MIVTPAVALLAGGSATAARTGGSSRQLPMNPLFLLLAYKRKPSPMLRRERAEEHASFFAAIMESLSGALLLVRLAVRGGSTAPANDSSQNDDRQQVRQTGKEIVVNAWISMLDTVQKISQVSRRWSKANGNTECLGSHED